MIFDSFLDLLNKQLIETKACPLNSVEILLLQGVWEDLTYSETGQKQGYSSGYLTNVAAPKLYKKLSQLLSKNVTKKNCRTLLESYISSVGRKISPCYPSGAVPLNSLFYVERPLIEEQACEEITKSGALIRIKAPKEMGKTSLLLRILDCAVDKGYKIIVMNLAQANCAILSNLDRFLRFLCANVTQQLDLEPKLDEYWDEDVGSKVSCSLYFRCYLLERVNSPIVLAFDELNRIFEYPEVAQDVLLLLRSWYEDGKRTPIWQKLRQIVVHSTEDYMPLKVNQSLNVGLPIELGSFDINQVKKLAEKYQLGWQENEEAEQLIDLVGGHPKLIQTSLHYLSQKKLTLAQLLKTALTPEGIYYCHLRRQWLTLQQEPQLAEFFNILLQTDRPLKLEPIIAYKLSSMGLIKQIGTEAIVSCQLYQNYFSQNFVEIESKIKS